MPKSAADETDFIAAELNEAKTMWGAALIDQIGPSKYSSLTRLCRVVDYVRRAVRKWLAVLKRITVPARWEAGLTVKELDSAFQDLCLASQEGATFPETTLNRLVVSKDKTSGLLWCYGRAQNVAQIKTRVPLVPYKAWISTLVTREAHEANHEGVAGTLLWARSKAWVIQRPRIARQVIDSCMHCRKMRARMCRQVMSELPPERTEPAAPFEFTALDLFGPYTVRDTARRRVKMKIWGVVFSCMVSKAVHADIVEDLSTKGFLKTYQRFTALRGHPRKLWSDQGTNFVGARPVLKDLYDFLAAIDKDQVQQKAVMKGTDWVWVFHPADSPHRNGAAEAAVRILKKALSSVGEEGTLTARCLRAIQIEVDKFWRRWSQLAGPGLFV